MHRPSTMSLPQRSEAISACLATLQEPVTLQAGNVRLRAVRDEDADAVFEVFSDPLAMRWWSRPPMQSGDEAVAYIGSMRSGFAARNVCSWATTDAGDRLIGTTTLHSLEPRHLRAEVGYILHPAHWGKGYAHEALGLALDWGFTTLGLNRVVADIAPGNDASVRLIERLGFQYEGRLRQSFSTTLELQDSLIYGLLAEEWRKPAV